MSLTVGGRRCELGFDWSTWQPIRDLRPAAAAGHKFAVIKATEGDSYRDPKYHGHCANVDAAGLVCGSYHFARPDWSDGGPYGDGRQEARHFLSVVDEHVRFAVLDLEATVLDAARTTDYAIGWWDQIRESGRFPAREQRVTYVGKFFAWRHAVEVRDASVLWIPAYTAGYRVNPDPTAIALPGWSSELWPEGWDLWQFTSSGTVAGVHPSDVNVALTSWVDAVRSGTGQTRDPFPQQEDDDMPRPVYRFPEGSDHPHAAPRVKAIDLRNGAFVAADGTVGYGPHWYHVEDDFELFELIVQRELEAADPRLFAAGNDALDRLYEDWPHVFRRTPAAPPAPGLPAPPVSDEAIRVIARTEVDLLRNRLLSAVEPAR